jgi:hypothetical protein
VSLRVTSVTLDGIAQPLDGVLASVTIRHGRVDVFDSPSPSTCQLTLLDRPFSVTHSFRIGGVLVVNAADGAGAPKPRFTGKITDASLDDNDLTVIAVGMLSTLTQYTVGLVDYPSEAWSARITRVFAEAGLAASLVLQAPPAAADPVLAARVAATAGPETLDDMLGELADNVGAAIADTPDGRILVQAISARTLDSLYMIDPDVVAYVPAFVQVLPSANSVAVVWTGGTQTATDPASIARYGQRPTPPLTITTTITTAPAAAARAVERVARTANPHWNMPSAPVLVGLDLAIGQAVEITELPPSAPYDPWTPIVEGWQDTIASDGVELDWTMELALSDPLASGLTLPWNAVPAADKWNTIDPVTAWSDALTLADLEV